MDKTIIKTLKEFKSALKTSGIKVERLILFGSHATGKAGEDNDIDLVVISDDFRDMDLWERLCLLGRARMGIKRPMEILGFTEEEFEEKLFGSFIGDEVKSKGVQVI